MTSNYTEKDKEDFHDGFDYIYIPLYDKMKDSFIS